MSAETSSFPVVRSVAVILAHVPSLVPLGSKPPAILGVLGRPDKRRDAMDVQAGQRIQLGFSPEEAVCVPER
jgi:hypothetical protein